MDLDDYQGKQLLRVLLQISMAKDAALSSQALKLLIRHFTQRQEMVKGFTQVLSIVFLLFFCLRCFYHCMFISCTYI